MNNQPDPVVEKVVTLLIRMLKQKTRGDTLLKTLIIQAGGEMIIPPSTASVRGDLQVRRLPDGSTLVRLIPETPTEEHEPEKEPCQPH